MSETPYTLPPHNLIHQLLNSYDEREHVSSILNAEAPCTAEIKLCNSSRQMQTRCREEYDGKMVEYVENIPTDYDAWKRLCALSVCVNNMYASFQHIIHSNNQNKRNFRTCFINLVMRYGTIAGGFILKNIGKKFRRRNYISHRNDIDVYMTPLQFQEFATQVDTLISHYPGDACRHSKSMRYIYSGLANNPQNIMYHIKFSIRLSRRRNSYVEFDIIVSPDPNQTIDNFDLSFCKVRAYSAPSNDAIPLTQVDHNIPLFDIAKFRVNFGDYDALFNKSGVMSEPFAREYYDGNRTTRNRVEKYLRRGYSVSIPKMPALNPGGFVQLRASNYAQLLQNRDDLPSGKKRVRSLMHTVAMDCPLAWIAHNYAETPQFANLLLTYITGHMVPSAKIIEQMRLLEDGLRDDTLTW